MLINTVAYLTLLTCLWESTLCIPLCIQSHSLVFSRTKSRTLILESIILIYLSKSKFKKKTTFWSSGRGQYSATTIMYFQQPHMTVMSLYKHRPMKSQAYIKKRTREAYIITEQSLWFYQGTVIAFQLVVYLLVIPPGSNAHTEFPG